MAAAARRCTSPPASRATSSTWPRPPAATPPGARHVAAGHARPAAGRPGPGRRPGRAYVIPDDIKALAVPGARPPAAAHPRGPAPGRHRRRRPGRGAARRPRPRRPLTWLAGGSAGVLTRQGWLCVVGGGIALIVARPGCSASSSCTSFGAVALGLVAVRRRSTCGCTRLDLEVDRAVHPPRVHAGQLSRVELRVAQPAAAAHAGARLRDPVAGTAGAELLVPPLDRGAASVAAYRLPTDRRGIVAGRPARGRGRPTRSAWRRGPAARRRGRAHRLPRVDDIAPGAAHQRQRPAGRAPTSPTPLGRSRRRLLRAAAVRGRRRPAPRPLAVDRPARRADGAPGRAALAGPHHRAARRPPAPRTRRRRSRAAVSAAASIVTPTAPAATWCAW